MRPQTSAQAIGEMASLLVQDHDVTDLLARLLSDCVQFLPVRAAGLLVKDPGVGAELLSATSHEATELELYQVLHNTGPCIDAMATLTPTFAVGLDAVRALWPAVGSAAQDAGFQSVFAFPLQWRGESIGGLNLFSSEAEPLDERALVLARSFADLAALALARPAVVSDEDLHARIQEALSGRVVIEQAKGVLAYFGNLSMAAAFEALLSLAEQSGYSLTDTARGVVEGAGRAH